MCAVLKRMKIMRLAFNAARSKHATTRCSAINADDLRRRNISDVIRN